MKILLLEDDFILSDIMYEHLSSNGVDVTLAHDGDSAVTFIENQKFDLFIFDINVPKISGIEILKNLREFQINTPAILITAYQDIKHLKEGFSAGCNDYIKKPFELEELDERINNIKRQFLIESNHVATIDDNILFNISKKEIIKNDKVIKLSQKECEVLTFFLNNKKRVISNEELSQNIWAYDEIPTDATLRVYIKKLRFIIGKDKIQTIRALGYYFE